MQRLQQKRKLASYLTLILGLAQASFLIYARKPLYTRCSLHDLCVVSELFSCQLFCCPELDINHVDHAQSFVISVVFSIL